VVNHVCFFSDICTGQNRNRFVCTALLHAVSTVPNIHVIDQKYLVSGHTQMECDSMHAAIENAKRNTSIVVPSQYDTIVRMERANNKYTVIPLKHQDFLNFKPIFGDILSTIIKDLNGEKINRRKLCWIKYRQTDPNHNYFKYNFEEEEFRCTRIKKTKRGKCMDGQMPQLYEGKLPISSAKKNDLISLCKTAVIPEEFHSYYENMLCDKDSTDCLPVPDVSEETDIDSDY